MCSVCDAAETPMQMIQRKAKFLPSVWGWTSVIYMLCKRGSGQGNNTNMSIFLICGPLNFQIVFS